MTTADLPECKCRTTHPTAPMGLISNEPKRLNRPAILTRRRAPSPSERGIVPPSNGESLKWAQNSLGIPTDFEVWIGPLRADPDLKGQLLHTRRNAGISGRRGAEIVCARSEALQGCHSGVRRPPSQARGRRTQAWQENRPAVELTCCQRNRVSSRSKLERRRAVEQLTSEGYRHPLSSLRIPARVSGGLYGRGAV